MFARHTAEGYREVTPGISLRTLNHGRNTLMAEFRLDGCRPISYLRQSSRTGLSLLALL